MVEDVITGIIYPVFKWCSYWTDILFESVGGKGIVLGIFMIVLVIGLLFIPMRGNAVGNIKAYSENKIHSKKRSSSKSSSKGD